MAHAYNGFMNIVYRKIANREMPNACYPIIANFVAITQAVICEPVIFQI